MNTSVESSQTLLKHERERKGYDVDEIKSPYAKTNESKKSSLCAQSRQHGGTYIRSHSSVNIL